MNNVERFRLKYEDTNKIGRKYINWKYIGYAMVAFVFIIIFMEIYRNVTKAYAAYVTENNIEELTKEIDENTAQIHTVEALNQKLELDRKAVELIRVEQKLEDLKDCVRETKGECLPELKRLSEKRIQLMTELMPVVAPVVSIEVAPIPNDKLTLFAEAVADNEGTNPNHLTFRYNNPGAMVVPSTYTCEYVGTGYHGFMKFETREKGLECLKKGIMKYRDRGFSIATFAQAWAPHSDNNKPTGYAKKLADKMGVDPDTQLTNLF